MANRSVSIKTFGSLAAFVFLTVPALPQGAVSTGGVTGYVFDATGAVVPNVAVVATNDNNGAKLTTKATGEGLYVFPAIAPGSYHLSFSIAGFKNTQVPNVEVSVGRTSSLDVHLEIGQVADQATVEATVTLLNPTDTNLSTVVDRKLIEDLPLSGRRYTDFVLLTPNVTTDGEFGDVSFGGQQGGLFSTYANGNASNQFTVDGANFTSAYMGDARGWTRVPYIFGQEAVQEFWVSDNPYSAAYGGAGTGFVNTVTKSGTDQFHGAAFYYNRNSGTGAIDAIDKANGRPRNLDVLQQIGASIGGPIKKNKLFFFFDYEQQRQKDPISVVNLGQQNVNQTNFGIPAGTPLPAPNSAFPLPTGLSTPDPNNPIYRQGVSNALNVIHSNIGNAPRRRDDLEFFQKLDWQATEKDHLTLAYNYNTFNSPGGIVTFNPVSFAGTTTLPSNGVRDHSATAHWIRSLSPNLVNDFHASYLRDEQIGTPTGLIDTSLPLVTLLTPQFFQLGNETFGNYDTREYQWEFNDRVNYVVGKHNFDLGFDWNRDSVVDFNNGSFRGSYTFFSLSSFALGQWGNFSQGAGNPVFRTRIPYAAFYANDNVRLTSKLTVSLGLREDFQMYPQPVKNPAIPFTGQFSNTYNRWSPRVGFAYQPLPKTVIRGGIGLFYVSLTGQNYEASTVANGLAAQQSSAFLNYNAALAPNAQQVVFPGRYANVAAFTASSNAAVVAPGFTDPSVLNSSLQIERELPGNISIGAGGMWTHGMHLLSSSAFDLNLKRPTGTTTYVVCPAGTVTFPCQGSTATGPNLDSGMLTEGAINPNVGQINALISPGLNTYVAGFAQLRKTSKSGLNLMMSYTLSKNTVSNGVDFNNQFDFSNTHALSLLDQRHRVTAAAVYEPQISFSSHLAKRLFSHWSLSTSMQFGSGRPYSGLLDAPCTGPNLNSCTGPGDNLNDSAFNQATGNTGRGIAGQGPSPNLGLNTFTGPWIDEVDAGLQRVFHLTERHTLAFKAQAFNLFNHANYFVQGGQGVNQLQYKPVGATCGNGVSTNQTCYLVPETGPGGFGSFELISQPNGPRVFQFSMTYRF